MDLKNYEHTKDILCTICIHKIQVDENLYLIIFNKAFNLQDINVMIHTQNTLSITLSSDFIDEDETTNTNLRNKII